MTRTRGRSPAALRALLLAGVTALVGVAAGCAEDAYRERWLVRLVQSGEYERAWSLFGELPEGSREIGDLRLQALFAQLGRHGLDHRKSVHVVNVFASGRTEAVWAAAAELARTRPELAEALLVTGEALSRPGDAPETRGTIAGFRLLGAFARLADEGGGGPPTRPDAIGADARRSFETALRFAAETRTSVLGSVSGVARVADFARDLRAEIEGRALDRWLAEERGGR